MKTKRTFASLCLAFSCCALITAANVSVGDQPGVVRLTSGQQSFTPPPVPPEVADTVPAPRPDAGAMSQQIHGAPPVYADQSAPVYQAMPVDEMCPVDASGMPMYQQNDYSPYFESSGGVTESPVLGRRPYENPLFGPVLMFETNVDNGLGFDEAYHRANVRLPHHVVPGCSVLIGDLSASLTNSGGDLYNFGLIWRNYDAMRNRVFGWNVYGDIDDGRGNSQWNRIGFGMESLGKYIDFRANGYYVTGDDSVVLNDQLVGDLIQGGNNVFRIRNQVRDNAYSGLDVEAGGPVPLLGRRGINGYIGGYYLDNADGYETMGLSARFQALVTESATVNVNYTNDDTFGVNSWVSVSYSIPNYGERTFMQPKCVRDRLADPVYRSSRIHSNIDVVNRQEAIINAKTGVPWNFVYVNPDNLAFGSGTFESPYNNLQVVADTNNAAIDVIQVAPREDDTDTNLTVSRGLDLFDCQALITSTKDYTLFSDGTRDFIIPGVNTTAPGPRISDPDLVAGRSVIRLRNQNTVSGFQIDASNADNTAFGVGISNSTGAPGSWLPITDARIWCNTFTNYTTATSILDASGRIEFDENTVTGVVDMSHGGLISENGLILTTAGPMVEVLIRNNIVNNSLYADHLGTTLNTTMIPNPLTTVGISVTANAGSTINADDPTGLRSRGPTGVFGTSADLTEPTTLRQQVRNSGDGIVMTALPGGTINALVANNESSGNARNGFIARADGGTFNLVSMRSNLFGGEDLNANGLLDPTEDTNGDGILDTGEDLNGNNILDPGEDVDGDGFLDLGEDLDQDDILRPNEDFNNDGVLAAGNGQNGAFLHYLNGGRFTAVTEDLNEDTNFNGIVDNGETAGLNGVLDVADGFLDTALMEDRNGNGLLDQGIVSNWFNDNGLAGLCIVGEGDGSEGFFTVGGPTPSLGNRADQNLVAGVGNRSS